MATVDQLIARETELMDRLVDLLREEYQWLCGSHSEPSPFLVPRAQLLKELSDVTRERVDITNRRIPANALAALFKRAQLLNELNERSLGLVERQVSALSHLRRRLASNPDYGLVGPSKACLGQG